MSHSEFVINTLNHPHIPSTFRKRLNQVRYREIAEMGALVKLVLVTFLARFSYLRLNTLGMIINLICLFFNQLDLIIIWQATFVLMLPMKIIWAFLMGTNVLMGTRWRVKEQKIWLLLLKMLHWSLLVWCGLYFKKRIGSIGSHTFE